VRIVRLATVAGCPLRQTRLELGSPKRRPAKAVRSPTRHVITCTSRRRLGASARILAVRFDGRISRSLAARSTSDGFPANPSFLRGSFFRTPKLPFHDKGPIECAGELRRKSGDSGVSRLAARVDPDEDHPPRALLRHRSSGSSGGKGKRMSFSPSKCNSTSPRASRRNGSDGKSPTSSGHGLRPGPNRGGCSR
jgi:hypothetical protein